MRVEDVRPVFVLLVASHLVLGVAYPVGVGLVAAAAFRAESIGSPVHRNGRDVGSSLVGQSFTGGRWFHGRPSATAAQPYDAAASTGTNLGPSNAMLLETVSRRLAGVRAAERVSGTIPVDLVTSSGSGLDAHISPASAMLQVPRVAAARGLTVAAVRARVDAVVEAPTLGLFGAPRVNVLRLNLSLEDP